MPRFTLALLLVAGLATTAHSQQADQVRARADELKAGVRSFRLGLHYNGDEDKPFYRLTLKVPAVEQSTPFHPNVSITEKQAEKIIDHLAQDGFLTKAVDARNILDQLKVVDTRNVTKVPSPTFPPGYTLTVGSFSEDLGWGLPLLRRLDGLRKVLDGDAAKGMDRLLGRLSGLRAQWQKEAVAQLIVQLGDDKLAVREAATKKLADLGEAVHPLLSETLKRADLDMETRGRIKIILGEKPTPLGQGPSVTDPASGITVTIGGEGNVLAASKGGVLLWKARMAGYATTLRLEGGLVIVSPDNAAYDPATGKMIGKKP